MHFISFYSECWVLSINCSEKKNSFTENILYNIGIWSYKDVILILMLIERCDNCTTFCECCFTLSDFAFIELSFVFIANSRCWREAQKVGATEIGGGNRASGQTGRNQNDIQWDRKTENDGKHPKPRGKKSNHLIIYLLYLINCNVQICILWF